MKNKVIHEEKAKRIWEAENELREAIDDAAIEGLVVEVTVDKYTNGTQIPRLLLKQVIFPILMIFFFVSIAAAQPYKFIFHRFPDNFKDGDTLVITRDKSERMVDLQAAPFSSLIATQDIKLPFTPQPRKSMQERSHQSAQKVGFRSSVDSSVIQFRFVTAQDLFNYDRECYADSTVHEELKPCFSLVNPPCPGHSYNPPRFYVTHREPTFPGFIKWLWRQK